jgi:NAD(P)H-hydrate epimerase
MVQGLKIVSASEMARLEKELVAKGASIEAWMAQAGMAIASAVEEFVSKRGLERTVTLLVGKGNNGGDARIAGAELLKKGWTVQEMNSSLFKSGVILDGLLGTGFRGVPEGEIAHWVTRANGSELPILSIDIPSGVDGNTGEIRGVAIKATETLCLGLPKKGLLTAPGWNHVGTIRYLNFGLSLAEMDSATAEGYLIDPKQLRLPPLVRCRHKYESGYVLALAGSLSMPGAASLSSLAALRSGSGIVRLFSTSRPTQLAQEVIWEGWNQKRLIEESRRARALLVGPGLGRSRLAKQQVQAAAKISLPCVFDADALFFLPKKIPPGSVLTPHFQELLRLLPPDTTSSLETQCQRYVDQKRVTLVFKGAVTWIFHPNTPPLVNTVGDPGMATAGSGDVLTGMIAAFLSQGLPAREASALAVHLHGTAGVLAAEQLTSYCLIASDLITFLPEAIAKLSLETTPIYG